MGALPNNELVLPGKSVEDRLRLVINTIPCLIPRATPDGAFDFINQQWLEFAGLKMEEVKGQGWHSTLHPEDVEKALSIWHAGLAGGKPFEHEARVRRFDGEYRWFLIRNVGGLTPSLATKSTEIMYLAIIVHLSHRFAISRFPV